MDDLTFAMDLFLATPMQRQNSAFILRRQADGEQAANGRTARPQMPRDTSGCGAFGSATLRAQDELTVAGPDHSAARTTCFTNWGPT